MVASSQAQLKIQAVLYCVDNAGIVGATSSRKSRPSWMQARCARRAARSRRERLPNLLGWGDELRQWSPPEGQHACLHTKPFSVDSEILICGLANATRSGLERNFEISARASRVRLRAVGSHDCLRRRDSLRLRACPFRRGVCELRAHRYFLAPGTDSRRIVRSHSQNNQQPPPSFAQPRERAQCDGELLGCALKPLLR